MAIIGLDPFGTMPFESYTPPIRDIRRMELSNAIFDEVHVRERVNGIDTSQTKEDWQLDTVLLAKFLGDLEAGNINNEGVQIQQFAIKRRKLNDIEPITLDYMDFVNNHQLVYQDFTQPNSEFIYSIVPVGENGLEGQENSISVTSNFAGWFLVDRQTNDSLPFDKFIGNDFDVQTTFMQNRTQIDTLTKYPSFFYGDQEYHEFQLQSVFIPEEWQRSGNQYEAIINQFVRSHKPFLVKGSSGEVYIVDVHSPSKSAPQNAYTGHDYMVLTLSFTEIMDYDEYMELTR